jgi:hypothetical protein
VAALISAGTSYVTMLAKACSWSVLAKCELTWCATCHDEVGDAVVFRSQLFANPVRLPKFDTGINGCKSQGRRSTHLLQGLGCGLGVLGAATFGTVACSTSIDSLSAPLSIARNRGELYNMLVSNTINRPYAFETYITNQLVR